MAKVVFVAPYALDATNRFLGAMVGVDDADIYVVSSDALERFPDHLRERIAGHWRIENCLDTDRLAGAVGSIAERIGGVDVLTAILENLQVPLAEVRARLGIEGMGVEAAEQFRDKARMKAVFAAHGIPCARNARCSSPDEVRQSFDGWGQPVVVKPLAGMGAQNTFRVDDRDTLERWLSHGAPTSDHPVLVEEFLTGREFTFESVLVDGELRWHSIGRYDPTPLTVLENPWIQWSVVLPRSIDGDEFDEIRSVGTRAVQVLGMKTGLSHLEWFRRPDGSIAISEVGARPPGAQISSLMSWAHDTDMYAAWARLMVHGHFDPPERTHAVGAAYLRAQGSGREITAITGLDRVGRRTHELVVEARLPHVGSSPADTYEGDGYVIVRADDTESVELALIEIISTIHVECS